MDLIRIICIITCVPLIYPIRKLVNKQDINIWDLLLMFSSLTFSVIPAFSDSYSFSYYGLSFFCDEISTWKVCLFLLGFYCVLLVVDVKWTSQKSEDYKNIANTSLYIRNLEPIFISKGGYVVLLLIALISMFWYVPKTSIMMQIGSSVMSYAETSSLMIFGHIFSLTYIICLLKYFQKDTNNILKFVTFLFFLLSLFLSRRTMTMYLIFAFVIYYSINIESFSFKKVFSYAFPIMLMLSLYFTFYNVIRRNDVIFDTHHPIESTIKIVSEGIDKWDDSKEEANSSTESRSLGVFVTLYRIVRFDEKPSYGALTLKSIDFALPSIINPNKGQGIQGELVFRCGATKDVSDSVLYDCYGEFHMFGFVYAVFYYYFFVICNLLIARIFLKRNERSAIGVHMLTFFFFIAWNIETDMSALITMSIQGILILIILHFLAQLNILYCELDD